MRSHIGGRDTFLGFVLITVAVLLVVAKLPWSMAHGITFPAPVGPPAFGSIRLEVHHESKAVPGAKVSVRDERDRVKSYKTDDTGVCEVGSLPPGDYSVAVEATGFEATSKVMTVKADQVAKWKVNLRR